MQCAIIVAKKERNAVTAFYSEEFMLKISRKVSVNISMGLTVVFLIGIAICAFVMPDVADLFGELAKMYSFRGAVSVLEVKTVLCVGYAIIALAALADIMMFFLLCRVRAGLVFTEKSVSLIRGVSWIAIICGILFAAVGYMFYVTYVVAVAMLFLGLCVRVVKNVVEEATEIKSENDLTV